MSKIELDTAAISREERIKALIAKTIRELIDDPYEIDNVIPSCVHDAVALGEALKGEEMAGGPSKVCMAGTSYPPFGPVKTDDRPAFLRRIMD